MMEPEIEQFLQLVVALGFGAAAGLIVNLLLNG